jgi:hypothetical protein
MAVQRAFNLDDGGHPLRLFKARARAGSLGLKIIKQPKQLRYWLRSTPQAVVPVDYQWPLPIEQVEDELTELERMHLDGCQG